MGPRASITDPKEQQRLAGIRAKLSADLGISPNDAAGMLSNLWAESHVRGINEASPEVPGSRGGWGWAQWTGQRRLDFEKFAASRGLDPASDEANYGFLSHELRTKYPDILRKLQRRDISATEAANLFFEYESGGAASLEKHRPGHVANAERISQFSAPTPAQLAPGGGSGVQNAWHNQHVQVGDVHVHTNANDARGIANDIHQEMKNAISQTNRGLE